MRSSTVAKSSTYLLRLDPQKKALWESKAREAEISLAAWIEEAVEAYISWEKSSGENLKELFAKKPTWAEPVDSSVVQVTPTPPAPYFPKGLEPKPFERKPVGKIAKMLKEGK